MNYQQVINIKNRKVGYGKPCFIVVEVSANHHQKLDEAMKIIKAAAKSGADAIKLQTYTPDTMTIDSNKKWFKVGGKDNSQNWTGKTLYQLYQTAYTPWEWFPKLKKLTESLGLIFFSSVFDSTSVDYLEKLKVACYKIGSYEVTDIPLLKKVANTRKPVILSVGYATLTEITEALKTLRINGSNQIAILHCSTSYATKPVLGYMNLRTISDIHERFQVVSGFSDNNAGIEIPIMAVGAGASIIEKHLILKRIDGGPDSHFSVEPSEVTKMIIAIRKFEAGLGNIHYGPVNRIEKYNLRFRRSIFAVEDIGRGEKISYKNVRVIRPSTGLAPKFMEDIIGKIAVKEIKCGTPFSWKLIRR